ncbi:helix-turn-helix domain-containing protein [Bradyrhizobium sp. CB1717]|uniref:helix-turn-helix domain-containing protein n=1 Tax=Bradyrhizobium sp. CB1717 TaxID=3039154 RepID=UPI0032C21AFE
MLIGRELAIARVSPNPFGLTIETVSRSLSYLRELGILRFIDNNQRHVVIIDRQQLAAF